MCVSVGTNDRASKGFACRWAWCESGPLVSLEAESNGLLPHGLEETAVLAVAKGFAAEFFVIRPGKSGMTGYSEFAPTEGASALPPDLRAVASANNARIPARQ